MFQNYHVSIVLINEDCYLEIITFNFRIFKPSSDCFLSLTFLFFPLFLFQSFEKMLNCFNLNKNFTFIESASPCKLEKYEVEF